ncbi:CLOCK-interacting pacemaker-like isoform 2-T5 [Aulostomus maculatus]
MRKEDPGLSEHIPCAPASKNAKDKSNSTTLRAMCDDSSEKGSRYSEKDSGYSDNSSDLQNTDVEDQRNNRNQSQEHADISHSNKSQEPGQRNPGTFTLMPLDLDLQPIYVMENLVLKQPDTVQKRGQLVWRDTSHQTGGSGATRMILFQQPSLIPASFQVPKPLSLKTNLTGRKTASTYTPVLNSYARIAPHPCKKPPDKSPYLSKRVCTELKSDPRSVAWSLLQQHPCDQPKLAVLTSVRPCSSHLSSSSPTAASSHQTSSSPSSRNTTSSVLASRGLHRNAISSTRHRRFLNTTEILRQSGLLDITLHTKELLRQSNNTERDIVQLRRHTELLCQAACNPSSLSGMAAYEQLRRTMAESGSYPDLKILQDFQLACHPGSACQAESVNKGSEEEPLDSQPSLPQAAILDPSQNFSAPQQPHTERHLEPVTCEKNPEKDTFMPPDSSTG